MNICGLNGVFKRRQPTGFAVPHILSVMAMSVAVSLCAAPIVAQTAQNTPQNTAQNTAQKSVQKLTSQIVTIDRQRLFSLTLYGQHVRENNEAEQRRIAIQTRGVEKALAAEERELTKLRETMDAKQFRVLATKFDEKVRELRQEGKEREAQFVRSLENAQLAFFEQIGPILGRLMRELGAIMIVDRRAVLLTTQNIDITQIAIDRIDRELGDGGTRSPSTDPTDTVKSVAPGTSSMEDVTPSVDVPIKNTAEQDVTSEPLDDRAPETIPLDE